MDRAFQRERRIGLDEDVTLVGDVIEGAGGMAAVGAGDRLDNAAMTRFERAADDGRIEQFHRRIAADRRDGTAAVHDEGMFEIDRAVMTLGFDGARARVGDAVIDKSDNAAVGRLDEAVVFVRDLGIVNFDQATFGRFDRAVVLVGDLVVVERDRAEIRGEDLRAVFVGNAVVAERDDAAAILGFNFAAAVVADFGVGGLDQTSCLASISPVLPMRSQDKMTALQRPTASVMPVFFRKA